MHREIATWTTLAAIQTRNGPISWIGVYLLPQLMRALNFSNQLWRRRDPFKLLGATAITGPVILRGTTANAVSSKVAKANDVGSHSGVFAPSMSRLKVRLGIGETAYWLTALVTLISLGAGIFFLIESGAMRTTDSQQVRLAAEDVPNQCAVTFDQAIQMLSVRH